MENPAGLILASSGGQWEQRQTLLKATYVASALGQKSRREVSMFWLGGHVASTTIQGSVCPLLWHEPCGDTSALGWQPRVSPEGSLVLDLI